MNKKFKSIIHWFKNLFKIKSFDLENREIHPTNSRVVYIDNIPLLYELTQKCISKEFDYDITPAFIEKEILAKREEEFKYNRIMFMITCDKSLAYDLSLIQQFGNLKYAIDEENGKLSIVVSGSLYDYRTLIKTIKNFNNVIFQEIKSCLYNLDKCFFVDFIQDEVMEERKFDPFPEQFYPNDKYTSTESLPDITELIMKIKHNYSKYQWYNIIFGITGLNSNQELSIDNMNESIMQDTFSYELIAFKDCYEDMDRYYKSVEQDNSIYEQIDIKMDVYGQIVVLSDTCSECGLPLIEGCFSTYCQEDVCSKCINKSYKLDDSELSVKMRTLRDENWNNKEAIRSQSDKIEQNFD